MNIVQKTMWQIFAAKMTAKDYRMKVGPGIVDGDILPAKIVHIDILTKPADEDNQFDQHGFMIIVHAGDYEFEMQQRFQVDDDPDAIGMMLEATISEKMGFKIGGNLVGTEGDPMMGIHQYTDEELAMVNNPLLEHQAGDKEDVDMFNQAAANMGDYGEE